MAEEIALSFAQDILKELLRYAANEAGLALSFKLELEKLEERSEMVAAFLSDAENKPSNDLSVQLWLKKLKAAVTKADAVLDEFHYELLRRKLEVQGRFTQKVTDFFSSSNNPISFRLRLAHNIKNINSRLDAINKEALELGLVQKVNTSASQALARRPPTHPGIDEKSVVGRDVDLALLVDKVIGLSDTKELPVIAIWGMGGQGKTTLAKLVCKNDRVVRRFDEKIWVCVSTNFDVTRLLNEMLESLSSSGSNMSNMGGMIKSLNAKLTGKRYLLILDDGWNENRVEWKSVRDALVGIGGAKSSTIIVTCRAKEVAEAMDSSYIHSLSTLSKKDSWTLFENKAFADGGVVKTEKLVEIGKEIVSRCGGVPLAIDVLGSLMHSQKSEGEWEKVVDHLDKELTNVQTILKLSYDHLSPSSLKSCFAFMSILEKDSRLDKDFFVQLWTALGMLPPSENSNMVLEDIGDEYFDMLVGKSLLQDARTDGYGYIEECRMHDLVHDLALQESKGYCFTVSCPNEVRVIPKDVVHLNFGSRKIETTEMANGCFRTLQTLIAGSLPENVVSELKLLRVLVLEDWLVNELPPSIGTLKHLRVLDVTKTSVRKLRSSITKLYHLQTLKVGSLDEIPKRFEDLVNLRHICIEHIEKNIIFIGLEKLTKLQTLPMFVVCREKGCLVGVLGALSNLKGKLEIKGLEDVKDEEEAKSAKLVDKSRIEALELWWGGNNREEYGESDMMEAVLEGLRPHSSLKSLSIGGFKGLKFPSWMISASDSAIKNVVKIKLVGCDRCEQVPMLGYLPNLKKVVMRGLKRVKKIGQEFYYGNNEEGRDHQNMQQEEEYFGALRKVVLDDMEMLEEWEDVKYVHLSSSSSSSLPRKIIQFRNLEKLKIEKCPNLKGVPSGRFPSLEEMVLVGCDRCEQVPTLGYLPNLKKVVIGGLKKVRKIGQEFYYYGNDEKEGDEKNMEQKKEYFGALRELVLDDMEMLEEWEDVQQVYMHQSTSSSSSSIIHFRNLEKLEIRRCGNLIGVPSGPFPSLKELKLNGVNERMEVQRMSSWGLTCLTDLYLNEVNCVGLERVIEEWFKNNTTSLVYVFIYECNTLVELQPRSSLFNDCVALKSLYIRDCSKLNVIPDVGGGEGIGGGLAQSLRELSITGCPELECLPRGIETLTSLQRLYIGGVDHEIPRMPSSLRGLTLRGSWGNVKQLPQQQLGHLSSLEFLVLEDMEGLEALPEWLPNLNNLQQLMIRNCTEILKERCVKGSGTDWPRIQHIPYILIDGETIQYI